MAFEDTGLGFPEATSLQCQQCGGTIDDETFMSLQEAIELGWCECVPCFKCRIPTGLDELSHGICPDCLRLGTRFGV